MPDEQPERWTTSQIAERYNASSNRSIAVALSRLGIRPVAREPGRSGQNLYDAAQVRAAMAARPGAGRRTDLGKTKPPSEGLQK